MKTIIRYLACVALILFAIATASRDMQAQDAAPIACKSPCVFAMDWGSGKTSANFPPDRRYGSGDDFESRFKAAMGARGFTLREPPVQGAITMTVRATTRAKVMCDAMPGLNPDMTCTAITDLAVSFVSTDPAVKAPGAMRISNRCSAGNIFMINQVFAQFAADMIWYQLEGQAAKAERPVSRC